MRGRPHRCQGKPWGRAIELFAGVRRFASACAAAGMQAESWELKDNPCEDVMDKENTKYLKEEIAGGFVTAVLMAFVCGTWSISRRNTSGKPGFPAPVRGGSGKTLWGLPGLSAKDRDKVQLGNRMLKWVVDMAHWCMKHNVAFILENPQTSRAWKVPMMKQILSKSASYVVHYCQFGMRWKKATQLVIWGFDGDKLKEFRCVTKAGCCSMTGAPHQQLSGVAPDGRYWTEHASAYPPKLCALLAALIKEQYLIGAACRQQGPTRPPGS